MAAEPSAPRLDQSYRAQSLWLSGLSDPLTPRPTISGDLTCDVAIIGAGFTGLWTAYYLKRRRPDAHVVVLEREIAGFGASGRNGGWVSNGIAGSAELYARTTGWDPVRRAVRETSLSIDEIANVVTRESIECGFAKRGMIAVATSQPQIQRLRAQVEASRTVGLGLEDLRELDITELLSWVAIEGALAATYSPHCARVDPARLVRGLADACERRGVMIYERSDVLRVRPDRLIICQSGTLRADHVIRATESYTTQMPAAKRKFLPLYSLMLATEPLPASTWDALGWQDGLAIRDQKHFFFYAQRTMDGRIAIGGRGAPYRLSKPISPESERNERVKQRLTQTLRMHFPPAADAAITHHWGGPLAVPRDWSMGIVYDPRRRIGWAGGYSGHGVVASNIAGRTLTDLILGESTELTTLPWVGHSSRNWEPEPLRYLAAQAIGAVVRSADQHEDSSGRPAKRIRLVSKFLQPH